MKKSSSAFLALVAGTLIHAAQVDGNAVLGSMIGAGAGAAVGSAVGGKEGAIIGGGAGGAIGAAVAAKPDQTQSKVVTQERVITQEKVIYVDREKGDNGKHKGHYKRKHGHDRD